MSTGQAAPTSPPEVPDEFAAAYREAYERALREQTDAPRHRRPAQYRAGYVEPTPFETVAARPPQGPVREAVAARPPQGPVREAVAARPPQGSGDIDLPERRGRLVIGTHRAQALDLQDNWFERMRGSRLFVPGLLMVLAVMLVLGAYVLGRAFTAAVGG